MLKAARFRVTNYRNIDDSGWIDLENITAFVGRNESGKSSLLKALHKFNPATPEPYNPQREFPRDRYTRQFKDAADWPVCSIAFHISSPLREQIEEIIGPADMPDEVICTRYYNGDLDIKFAPPIEIRPIEPAPLIEALGSFAAAARRLPAPSSDQEEQTQKTRTDLAIWASEWKENITSHTDLRGEDGRKLLSDLRGESEMRANPQTADMIEELQKSINAALAEAGKVPPQEQIEKLVEPCVPVFIYFENYGILDSAIYLPRFLESLQREPNNPRTRTINAMFKHVGLSAQEITDLGREQTQQVRAQNQQPTAEMIAQDQQRKEARAIKLNSASLDITRRFNEWYQQRRHNIVYQADGDYFRVWISDDRRPGVEIELEGRSKGFQWFFSFYLVFLVESDEQHKDAILLLDEPGLHLHPTAQQGLIAFFEKLAENNQLLYSTHSPFLIDGEHLHRVRPVAEDESGHSSIHAESWPSDRETIFPLQAAAGYAMVRGLFQHHKNVLVEGMSDYYYLHALSQQCLTSGRTGLPEDVYIVPCGGTKNVGIVASLFLGQDVRPLVLLDGDEAGKVRKNALINELYTQHLSGVLMLDEALDTAGVESEVEDILGEDILCPAIEAALGVAVQLSAADRNAGSLPSQIKAWAKRCTISLPDGWKPTVACYLVSSWAEGRIALSEAVLDRAASLFSKMQERFAMMDGGSSVSS